jgi:hypothetical protein
METIIISKHEEKSRKFKTEKDYFDWYEDEKRRDEWINSGKPCPNAFPFYYMGEGISFAEFSNDEELEQLKINHLDKIKKAKEDEIRKNRDFLLRETDFILLEDAPKAIKDKNNDWKKYRQDLRDITKQAHFPDNIQWPVKP